jgi:hypothetical protein
MNENDVTDLQVRTLQRAPARLTVTSCDNPLCQKLFNE